MTQVYRWTTTQASVSDKFLHFYRPLSPYLATSRKTEGDPGSNTASHVTYRQHIDVIPEGRRTRVDRTGKGTPDVNLTWAISISLNISSKLDLSH